MKVKPEIRTRRIYGGLCNIEYQVYLRGEFIGARLSFITDEDAADMVRMHLLPKPALPAMTSHANGSRDAWRSRKGATNAAQSGKARRPMRDVFDEEEI